MSVHKLHYQNGLFFAQYTGAVSQQDAERWLIKLHYYAVQHPLPLVALVDLRETEHISVGAQRVFMDTSRNAQIAAIVIAARQPSILQTAHCIQRMAAPDRTHVFSSLFSAFSFSRSLISKFAVQCS